MSTLFNKFSRLTYLVEADRSLAVDDELCRHSEQYFPNFEYNGRYSTPHPQVVVLLDLRCFISKAAVRTLSQSGEKCPPFLAWADWRHMFANAGAWRRLYGLHNHLHRKSAKGDFRRPIRPEFAR